MGCVVLEFVVNAPCCRGPDSISVSEVQIGFQQNLCFKLDNIILEQHVSKHIESILAYIDSHRNSAPPELCILLAATPCKIRFLGGKSPAASPSSPRLPTWNSQPRSRATLPCFWPRLTFDTNLGAGLRLLAVRMFWGFGWIWKGKSQSAVSNPEFFTTSLVGLEGILGIAIRQQV